jgi:ADP-heptose:LPS heptosyltransferase
MERITYGRKKRILALFFEAGGWLIWQVLRVLFPVKKAQGTFRILIIEPFMMGDVVALSALLQPLRSHLPGAFIAFCARPGALEAARFFEGVDVCIPASFPWRDTRKGFGKWFDWLQQMMALRREVFQLGIDVRGDVRSQVSLRLAGCRRVLSYKRYVYSDIVNRGWLVSYLSPDSPFSHILDRNRFLLRSLGIGDASLFPVTFPLVRKKAGLPASGPPGPEEGGLLLHIGASWQYKRWPADNWVSLIRSIRARFPGLAVTVVAGPDEKDLMTAVQGSCSGMEAISFWFPGLEALFDAIAGCRLLIGCDSGPMSIANALDIPRIALFGPGPPGVWRPYTEKGRFLQKTAGYSCYPCEQIQCVRPDSPCIAQIRPQDVEQLAFAFLETGTFPA